MKYAWSCVKAEDVSVQYWANVNLCRFFSAFESPSKIIVQVIIIFYLLLSGILLTLSIPVDLCWPAQDL